MGSVVTFFKRATRFIRHFVGAPLAHWPFVPISRKVFGNTAGFRQNLYGSLYSSYCRLFGKRSPGLFIDPEVRQLARDIRRNGFALAKGWLDLQTLQLVRGKILSHTEKENEGRNEYMKTLKTNIIVKNVPEVFRLFTPRMTAVVEEYYGSSFLIDQTGFRLTYHVPDDVLREREVYSNHWHCDCCPSSQLAVFIILNDVSEADGPTAALSISDTREMIRKGYKSRNRNDVHDVLFRAMDNHPAKAQLVGPAGTILFANVARCLHRAGIPEPGRHREWLQFRLHPCLDATDTSRLRPAKIKEYISSRKYIASRKPRPVHLKTRSGVA